MIRNFIGQKMGSYRVTQLLGMGGFGSVYLAEHIYLNTQVAIKLLNMSIGWRQPELLERLRKEAFILSRLKHPNIIKFIEFGAENNIPYLIMAYAPKGSILSKYPHGTQLPITSVINYVKQIASALQYIHEQNLVYNAIKPENILIDENDKILLGDFGDTVPVPSDGQRTEINGTLAYMAPEQFEGYWSQAIDIYALGTVVYEWLSGSLPSTNSTIELMINEKNSPLPLRERIPTIPPMVETVVMKALDPDPKHRFKNVKAFVNALEQSIQVKPSATISDESIPLPSSPFKKSTSASGAEIFICYAHEDEILLKSLEKHLSALKRQGLINIWYDRSINAGTEWEPEIDKHLSHAQIILLLVSSDFMASDYCYGTEMKRAMERHEQGDAHVIPIILRPVYWKNAPFSKLQVLPQDAKPILSSSWHNLDEAFFDVVDGIQKAIEKLNE